jgi:RsiW-degrading membrane proteinase PrsW (M82 family)
MRIKSKFRYSVYISVFWGVAYTTFLTLIFKYIEHFNIPFWLIIFMYFFSITACFLVTYFLLHQIIEKITAWMQSKHKGAKR